MTFKMLNFYENRKCIDIDGISSSPFNNKKRKMDATEDVSQTLSYSNSGINHRPYFLPIRSTNCIYHTEDWESSGTVLFKPLLEDVLVNTLKHDQISCMEGSYFIADNRGNYQQKVTGHVVHLWRYNKNEQKLYISRSFLFTNLQEYLVVQQFLQRL